MELGNEFGDLPVVSDDQMNAKQGRSHRAKTTQTLRGSMHLSYYFPLGTDDLDGQKRLEGDTS